MTFEEAMKITCKELGYDGHLKTIECKKNCHTYAEKIIGNFSKRPFWVKNSYMFLDGVDFCFHQNGEDVNFAISGYIANDDKLNVQRAIHRALQICSRCEWYMKHGNIKGEKQNEID